MTEHNFEKIDGQCIWKTSVCGGDVFKAKIFNGKLTLLMCENCLNDHRNLMTLNHELCKKNDPSLIINYLTKMPASLKNYIVQQFQLLPWDKI